MFVRPVDPIQRPRVTVRVTTRVRYPRVLAMVGLAIFIDLVAIVTHTETLSSEWWRLTRRSPTRRLAFGAGWMVLTYHLTLENRQR